MLQWNTHEVHIIHFESTAGVYNCSAQVNRIGCVIIIIIPRKQYYLSRFGYRVFERFYSERFV